MVHGEFMFIRLNKKPGFTPGFFYKGKNILVWN